MFTYLEIIAIIIIAHCALKIIWKLLKGLWTCGLGHALGFGIKWRPAPDVWAVVTGATDGIGLEYAKVLAQKGYSLLIISRSEQKLKKVANEIKNQCPKCHEIKTLAVDFRFTDKYSLIKNEIESLKDVDVLVNNVGIMYPIPEYFENIPSSMNEDFINVNMVSYVKMCEIVIPIMIKQKRGIIINISSVAADNPGPFITMYTSTKVFNDFLSRGLSIELKEKGITVQTVCPGGVSTSILPESWNLLSHGNQNALTAKEYVSEAIKTVGIEWRTYGHRKHKFMAFIMNMIAQIIGSKYWIMIVFKMLKNMREKILQKKVK